MGEVPRAKAPKKKAKSKKKRPVGEMIVKAVSASNERSGVSLHTLKQVLAAEGYNVEKNNYRIILSIRTLVTKGTLVRIRGVGASGSFKLNDQTETAKKPAKVAAPKAKQPEAKKSEAAKKPVAAKEATKSPKKAEAAKSKVAKPKATKAKKSRSQEEAK